MNTRIYWILSNLFQKLSFGIKKTIYSIRVRKHTVRKTKSVSWRIFKMIISQTLKASLVVFFTLVSDGIVMHCFDEQTLDHQFLLDIVIGGIGVAGVILGLYCSNMASMFSSKYTNAPESISTLYQNDILSNKCVRQITGYISLDILLLAICIAKIDFFYVSVISLLILTIRTIVTFSISGNRAYNLANTYRIADNIYTDIMCVIDYLPSQDSIDTDKSIQKHYRKMCAGYVGVLNDIATYNKESLSDQTEPICRFIQNNIAVIFYYVKKKPGIKYDSFWYADRVQYQQWHNASHIEVTTKIPIGLTLDTKKVKDYSWFEKEFQAVNEKCVMRLVKARDYRSIYIVLATLSDIPNQITAYDSIEYWNQYVCSLDNKVLFPILDEQDSGTINDDIAGIVDAYATVLFNVALSICKTIKELNVKDVLHNICSAKKYSKRHFPKTHYVNCLEAENFLRNIDIEKRIEGQQVTPKWCIEEFFAKRIYNHVNLLATQLTELMEHIVNIGTKLIDKKFYYYAAIWNSRLSEVEARMSHEGILEKLSQLNNELLSKKKDPKIIWNDSRIDESKNKIQKIIHDTPYLLKKCSGFFAFTHQDDRTDYPDLFGYCYNRICDSLITAIASDDLASFKAMYSGFLGTTFAYQEYIRTDLIKIKEEHLHQILLKSFSSPVYEFSVISGLAIIWGEFVGHRDWYETVNCELEPYKDKTDTAKFDLLRNINLILSARRSLGPLTGDREIVVTGWEQRITSAIRRHPNYIIEILDMVTIESSVEVEFLLLLLTLQCLI